jgi:glycosyltransferase involved in cell wall biosynthesis
MIHLVINEPVSYQIHLSRTLHDYYDGGFIAWFRNRGGENLQTAENSELPFVHYYLNETGYWKLFQALRSDNAAVVVLGGWSSPMAARTLLIAKMLRRRIFIWADHPHPRKRSWIAERARITYLRILARFVVNGFLLCGRPTLNHVADLGIPPDQLTNFPYWIDTPANWSLPDRCNSGETNKPFHLVAVGRHVPVKGFDVAIRAVELINRRAGYVVCKLTIIGDGPERVRLQSLAESLNAENTVVFSGWQSNDQVRSGVLGADAVVVPSKFEPYGVVVLEALAGGRPVLASDQTIAALDRDDGSGAISLHRAGDFERLAQQIETLINDRDRLATSCHAARAIAEKWPAQRAVSILHNTIAKAAGHPNAVSVYDELVEGRTRPNSTVL